jgi:hypothetical protein
MLAAGCGLRFWAGLAIAVTSKMNRAMWRMNFGMAEFFSLWSEARLKKLRMEGKPGGFNQKGDEGTQRDSGIAKIASIAKIAEIEKQRLLASDGEGESKYPKGVCATTPVETTRIGRTP